jgi:penicillin-binding protein 2
MVRAVAAVANGGNLLTPTVILGKDGKPAAETTKIVIPKEDWQVVREGMRLAVTEGTAKGLDIYQIQVAAKTGTAELGVTKKSVNSWVIGFFPYQNPRYAFAAVMEKGPSQNTIGALFVVRQFLEWLSQNAPEYLK